MNFPIKKMAEVTLKVGLNIQPGQRLVLSAPIEAVDFVRELTRQAYDMGASLVIPFLGDEQLGLIRVKHAPKDSFSEHATWLTDGITQHVQTGDALLRVSGNTPDLYDGQDHTIMGEIEKTYAKHSRDLSAAVVNFVPNWNIVAYPTLGWAKKIFPDDTPKAAVEKLSEAIAMICRADQDDPIKAWDKHRAMLKSWYEYLNKKQYKALHFTGPGTDFTVGLAKSHIWMGGSKKNKAGIEFTPNIPTEEVYTLPDRNNINGTVRSTKPLNHGGSLVEGLEVTFKDGKVTDFKTTKGKEVFQNILDIDEGAVSLGEVALVPESSPIAKSGLLFYNTLFDENASHHIALGNGYRPSVKGGSEMSDDEFKKAGGNVSQTHVDFMIGSKEISVDGITSDGKTEPLLKNGDWVISF